MNNNTNENASQRGAFTSKLGVVMATAGSAVGLGNVWRFPTEVGQNGGAAFILIYLLCILLLGIPVMICEFVIGRHAHTSAKAAFAKLAKGKKWRLLGLNCVLSPFFVMSFYMVVAGWTLYYMLQALIGGLGGEVDHAAQFARFSTHSWWPVACAALFMFITHWVVSRGVQKGIERSSRLMMPMLLLIIAVMVVCSLSMPGTSEGLSFLLQPDFSKVDTLVVLSAIGQSFFSLSLGMGCLITYASYFGPDTNLTRTACSVGLMDTMVAVMCGFFIFPAVFSVPGVEPGAGPGLAFITLPNVFHLAFASVPVLGYVFTVLFYMLLMLAALTSTISLHETLTAYMVEQFSMTRSRAAMWVTGSVLTLCVLCAWSFGPLSELKVAGLTLFDLFDFITSNVLMPLGGIFICLFVGWRIDRQVVRSELSHHGRLHEGLFSLFMMLVRYVVPLAITAVFLQGLLWR